MTLLPWIETIPLLRVSEHTLISGRRQNLYYSSLYHEPVYLCGLQLIYTNPELLPASWWLMICESNVPDTWTPFFMRLRTLSRAIRTRALTRSSRSRSRI